LQAAFLVLWSAYLTQTVSCILESASLNIAKVFGIAQLSQARQVLVRPHIAEPIGKRATIDSAVLDALPATLRLAARGNKTMHVDGNDTRWPDQITRMPLSTKRDFGKMPIMSEHFAETELP
jgi:hypothetical protein